MILFKRPVHIRLPSIDRLDRSQADRGKKIALSAAETHYSCIICQKVEERIGGSICTGICFIQKHFI